MSVRDRLELRRVRRAYKAAKAAGDTEFWRIYDSVGSRPDRPYDFRGKGRLRLTLAIYKNSAEAGTERALRHRMLMLIGSPYA